MTEFLFYSDPKYGIRMNYFISTTTEQILLTIDLLLYCYLIMVALSFDRSRKAGTVFLTTQGLIGDEVRSLTKHNRDVFEKDYMCELSILCMNTMAGFLPKKKHGEYYVPRATISLPNSMTGEDLVKILFPMINTWRLESRSQGGDASASANSFLHSVLPYLCEVMAQDGVLWMRNHPANPSVRLLDHLLQGKTGDVNYTTWCQQKFLEIQNKVQRHEAKMKAEEDLVSLLAEDRSLRRNDHLELMGKIREMVSTNFVFLR